jgi:aminoglycoside phosphotransferase (APT) family kinase protein
VTEIALPPDVLDWIASATGHRILAANRIPGGGTREGWFIDLDAPDEADRELFLRYSAAPPPQPSAFHSLATEARVVQALGERGMRVATVHAIHPDREAVLLGRVPGETWFYRITDPDEQVKVAQDFITNLAATHRLDAHELGLPELGPVKTVREHALDRIADIRRRATTADGTIDPLLRLSVDWLENNVPDYDGPVVLVQGDTGPGNFMYENGRVTAVLDWELCHWGDPMDDIAWLSLRTVQDTFTHLPDRLAEYAELSGYPIDPARVWYYRLFAEATMATLYPPGGRPGSDGTDGVVRDVGNMMLYTQLHRRLWLETLNVLMGLDLPKPEMPSNDQPADWHVYYTHIQAVIKTITPRITDPLALQWTKGVARAVRYLEQLDLDGRDYDDLERGDLERLLDAPVESLHEARPQLAEANRQGTVADEDYVGYLWNKTMRDDHLMRTASGALHTRTWPPLT